MSDQRTPLALSKCCGKAIINGSCKENIWCSECLADCDPPAGDLDTAAPKAEEQTPAGQRDQELRHEIKENLKLYDARPDMIRPLSDLWLGMIHREREKAVREAFARDNNIGLVFRGMLLTNAQKAVIKSMFPQQK